MDEVSTATSGRTSKSASESEPGAEPDAEPDSPPSHNPFKLLHARLHRNPVTGIVTKVVITVIGVGVLCAGLVMMVTPGPGIVGIIVGLAILALEYDWAERWMHAARKRYHDSVEHAKQLDPAVRRRRIALALLIVVLVVGGVVAYLVTYDWPTWALLSWDAVQGIGTFVPELPGM